MKFFLELGNRYAKESDWRDFALTKFCLCAAGIVIGLLVPDNWRYVALVGAAAVFLLTYVFLMNKVYKVYKEMRSEKKIDRTRNII